MISNGDFMAKTNIIAEIRTLDLQLDAWAPAMLCCSTGLLKSNFSFAQSVELSEQ